MRVLVIISALALFVGCITTGDVFERGVLAHYSTSSTGWTRADGVAYKNPVKVTDESLANGKKNFDSYCASCHGENGRGDGDAGADLDPMPANLAESAAKRSESYLYLQISQGRLGMPIWKSHLDETARWELVNYLKTLSQ